MKFIKAIRFVVINLIIITTISSISYGQKYGSEEHYFYLGPQIGVFNAMDADVASFIIGAAARYKFAKIIGAEASINYREEKYANNRVTVSNLPIMLTALVYPFPYAYGGIGVGWYNSSYTYNNDLIGLDLGSETRQRFGWHFGGGAEVPVGNFGKIVGDLRYVFLDYGFKEFPGSEDVSADYYSIMIGFLFGL